MKLSLKAAVLASVLLAATHARAGAPTAAVFAFQLDDTSLQGSMSGETAGDRARLAMLDAHKAGEADHSRRIWTILVFQIWHEIFVTGALKPEIPEPAYPVYL